MQTKVLRRRNLRVLFSEVFLLLCSTFVLAMAFPSFLSKTGFGFLVFIALIPVFAVIRNTTFRTVWFYGFLYGYVYYWIFNYWLSAFHPMANVLVQIIKGTEMLFLFVALKAADGLFTEKHSYVVQGLIWVAYSYLSQSWYAGYPYGTVAYALYNYPRLIQIADFSGIWLLNFIIVFPQAYLGRWFCDRISRTKSATSNGIKADVYDNRFLLAIYAVLVLFQLVYGFVKFGIWHKAQPDGMYKIAAVQHNANSWGNGYETYKKNFNTLRKMSLEAKEQNPDLIVWSETAFVPSVKWYTMHKYDGTDKGSQFDYLRKTQVLVDEFVDFGKTLGVPLVTGNPSSVIKDNGQPAYDKDGYWNKDDYNSVILFDEGQLKDVYLKQHLVPFTEHFPYEKQLPWLYRILKSKNYSWWEKGYEPKVFRTSNGIEFSSPICFEDVFGYLCADFVKNGAQVLINLTNDSWSGSEAAERQHAYMAVFRSIETRKAVLRSTNSGLSCLIMPDGTISGEMEPFKTCWQLWEVPVYSASHYGQTVYTRTSDFLAVAFTWASVLLLVSGMALNTIRYIKRKK